MQSNENRLRPQTTVGEASPSLAGKSNGVHALRSEIQAAATAAAAHARKTAATAKTEAQLSAASAIAVVCAAILGFALLIISWMCVLVLGIWLAVEAGWPLWAALVAALCVNLAGVLVCGLWSWKLLPNIGFSRTRKLMFSKSTG